MFEYLPQECILLILGFVLQKPVYSNPETNYEKRVQYGLDWTKDKSLPYVNALKQGPSYRNLQLNVTHKWCPPPFTRVIPLTMLSNKMNDIFDNEVVWTYIYEQEFRKGVIFKRRPKKAKIRMMNRSKEIIKKRYTPILKYVTWQLKSMEVRWRNAFNQIHIIDTALSKIRKPEIPAAGYWDINSDTIDELNVILPVGYVRCTIRGPPAADLPAGYTLSSVAWERENHQSTGNSMIKRIKESKNNCMKIEKILSTLK